MYLVKKTSKTVIIKDSNETILISRKTYDKDMYSIDKLARWRKILKEHKAKKNG